MRWLTSLFAPGRSAPLQSEAPIFFTNTVSGKKELFSPIKAGYVTMYSCGPTVYSKAQIGNLRAYVFSDLIARTLSQAGYHVRRVINITDVGHLQGDGDEGEDKMEIGAKREGLRAEDVADRYTRMFLEDLDLLNIDTTCIQFPRATEYIKEQIAIISLLEEKGFTYRAADGIYFDTSRYPNYGILDHGGPKLREEAFAEIGRRIASVADKRHPADFALWKLSPPQGKRQQEWRSPWGIGFPGWHIECSAMARSLLGQPIDIHTGGIDHIPVHHTNEIAQSECAFGKPLARFWMHGAFLTISGEKISKSLGNDVYLSDIVEKGCSPLALRYLFLQAHYSTPLSFTYDALLAANEALTRLTRLARQVSKEAKGKSTQTDTTRRMVAILRDDLATPAALALLWDTLRDEDLERAEQFSVIEAADAVLGLGLLAPVQSVDIPEHVLAIVEERERARREHDFDRSDALRIHIENSGYHVEDRPEGPVVTRRPG